MKKVSVLTLALFLATAGFGAGAWYQHRSASAPGAGRKILHYVDPMHPAYTSDKPGIAPDCGMQLEPVYADEGPAGPSVGAALARPAGTVNISGERQQLFGVQVATVESSPTAHTIRIFGHVAPEETRIYTVNAAVEGNIRAVSEVTTGSHVHKDQWLASFFSADSRTPLQAYITALDVQDQDPLHRVQSGMAVAAGSTASTSAQYTVERLRGFGMSTGQIEQIRRTRQIPLIVGIHSPADGFVIARNVSIGQKFDKGAEWFRIANLDKVWIVADVLEDEARYLRPGMTANVSIPHQRTSATATVSEVLPQFDPASRSMKVRLEADNAGYALRPDMFVDVEFPIELPAAITVPIDAVIDSGRRKTVFVERGEGFFEPRTVETGWRFGEQVEIVHGLAAGERVVTSGTFLVDSESRLKAAAAGVFGASSKDPVCGMDVDEARAKAAGKTTDHHGKSYFFCSEQCRSKFTHSPEQYLETHAGTSTALSSRREGTP